MADHPIFCLLKYCQMHHPRCAELKEYLQDSAIQYRYEQRGESRQCQCFDYPQSFDAMWTYPINSMVIEVTLH